MPGPDESAQRPTARDLVRRRSGDYRAVETGRHHHLGAAPVRQPVLGESGVAYVETAPVQLRQRTLPQLHEQLERHEGAMQAAAAAMDFERAATERDAAQAVRQEIDRRQ